MDRIPCIIAQRLREGVGALSRQTMREALREMHLPRIVGRVAVVALIRHAAELRVDYEEILRQAVLAKNRAGRVAAQSVTRVEEVGQVSDLTVRKERIGRGVPPKSRRAG